MCKDQTCGLTRPNRSLSESTSLVHRPLQFSLHFTIQKVQKSHHVEDKAVLPIPVLTKWSNVSAEGLRRLRGGCPTQADTAQGEVNTFAKGVLADICHWNAIEPSIFPVQSSSIVFMLIYPIGINCLFFSDYYLCWVAANYVFADLNELLF